MVVVGGVVGVVNVVGGMFVSGGVVGVVVGW